MPLLVAAVVPVFRFRTATEPVDHLSPFGDQSAIQGVRGLSDQTSPICSTNKNQKKKKKKKRYKQETKIRS